MPDNLLPRVSVKKLFYVFILSIISVSIVLVALPIAEDSSLSNTHYISIAALLAFITSIYYRWSAYRQGNLFSNLSGIHQAILNTATDSILTVNKQGIIVEANKATESLFGYDPGQLTGKPVSRLMPARYVKDHNNYLINHKLDYKSRVIGKERTVMGKKKGGHEFPIEISISKVSKASQVYFTAIIRDVSERFGYENALYQNQRTLDALLTAADEIVLIINRKGICELANNVAIKAIDINEQDIKGAHLSSLNGKYFPHLDETKLLEALRSEKPIIEEVRVEELSFEIHWCPMLNGSGLVDKVAIFARDISKQKLVEDELSLAKEIAEQANSAKSNFLSKMSHEFRTPLNVILGFTQILLDEKSKLKSKQIESLELVKKSGDHLLELVDDVLDLAKIEAGVINIPVEVTDAKQVVEECHAWAKPIAKKASIDLDLVVPDQLPWILSNTTRLKQVLLNLISNAIKYNRRNGKVSLEVNIQNTHLCFVVKDNGFGIPLEQQPQLFSKFSRLGAEHRSVEGSGIGLALSKELVTAMNGDIGVESSIGTGSKFWVCLPIAESGYQDEQLSTESTSSPFSSVTSHNCANANTGYKVLYVEDNPANVKLVESIISIYEAHELVTAVNKEDGLALAKNFQFDLILMDLNLPDGSGFDLISELKGTKNFENTPTIAVTADALPITQKRAKEAGFDELITKPIDIGNFLKILRFYLDEDQSPANQFAKTVNQ